MVIYDLEIQKWIWSSQDLKFFKVILEIGIVCK